MSDQVKKRVVGRPFKKGESANPGGRPKGSPNQALVAQKMAIVAFGESLMADTGTPLRALRGKWDKYTVAEILASRPYLEGVVTRIKNGDADHLEKFIWEHVFGKPVIRVRSEPAELTPMQKAMEQMSPAEITILAEAARKAIAIRDARSLTEGEANGA